MDNRKEWDELVEWISKEDPPTWKQRNCILWADARIKALEEAVERLREINSMAWDAEKECANLRNMLHEAQNRIKALEEAVEWACMEMRKGNRSHDDWDQTIIETKRRAGRE